MESKYLERFKRYNKDKRGKLFGDQILVEVLPQEEKKSSGGIILAESQDQRSEYGLLKSTLAIVLEVGEGYTDEKGNDLPLDRKIGELLMIHDGNARYLSTLPGLVEAEPSKRLAIISDAHIYKSWDTVEDYEADTKLLTGDED